MATIEAVSWIIRLGDFTKKSGDDFNGVCFAVKAGLDTLRMTGMLSREEEPKLLSQIFSLRDEFLNLGFNKIIYERVIDGGFKTETLILRRS